MNEQSIGLNIRHLREQARLTVTALARKARMTKSALSKIETGRTSSPISTLLRIAEALEVTISEFFVEEETNPPFVLTRKGQGRLTTRNGSQWGYAYEALALEMNHKIGEPFLLTIKPGDPKGKFQHGGHEFIYMLSGRMIFTVGEHVLRLNPGDSLYFDPARVHTTRVTGKQPARFICVFMQDRIKGGDRKLPRAELAAHRDVSDGGRRAPRDVPRTVKIPGFKNRKEH